jgi:head-tail adaptor
MSLGFSAAELAQIRADILALLPDTCSILAVTNTSDGAGGVSETWGTVTGGTAVPCRLDYRKEGRESVTSAALNPYHGGILSVAYDQSITTANRVEISGQAYNVTGVNNQQGWLVVQQVSVERVP